MRLAILGSVCVLGACGAGYRYEAAGHGTVAIGEPAAATSAPGSGGVNARAGVRHDVVVRVSLPRAEVVTWQLTCPGATASGTVGETIEAYRARRLGELRAERDRERAAAASIGGAIGGAVLGRAGASAQVVTPSGTAAASAHVDGSAVGAAAGAASVSDDVALAPDDVGGGMYTDRATVVPAGDGACVVAVWPADGADPGGLAGEFEVTRVINRDAEERARRAVIVGHATEVRASIAGSLVALGADAGLRARMRAEAEARAQAEASARAQVEITARARVQVEVDARAQLEADWRARAYSVRGGVIAYLTVCGGDPSKRQREREARARLDDQRRAEQARVDEARRAQIEAADARAQAEAEAIAEAEARRAQLAFGAREAQIALLVSLGAMARPPMPPLQDENPGAPPVSGLAWISGHWEWDAPQWVWQPGGWAASEGSGFVVDGAVSAGTTSNDDGAARDHRDTPPPPPTTTTTPPPPPPPTTPNSASRDHRATPPPSPTSGSRDHRR